MFNTILLKVFCFIFLLLLVGCSGLKSFPDSARAGDTITIAAGWKKSFSRDNITVLITPSSGASISYLPGNPAVRAVINLYPDPLSSLFISGETRQDITPFGRTYSDAVYGFVGGEKDIWQTAIYLDLPPNLPVGLTNIRITNSQGISSESTLEIIPGTGDISDFEAEFNGPLSPDQLAVLERVVHYVISFSGDSVPHAIQVEFSHDATASSGGIGEVYVSNPRGDIKSVIWNDDGNKLKVILMPTRPKSLTSLSDFKFYIAGGVRNIQSTNILAVDIDGVPESGVNVDAYIEK